jgi:tight adherence protein B
MKVEALLLLPLIPMIGGVVATRLWVKQREAGTIAQRLARWMPESGLVQKTPHTVLKKKEWDAIAPSKQFLLNISGLELLRKLLIESGQEGDFPKVITLVIALLISPPLIAFALGFNILIAQLIAVILCLMTIAALKVKAEALRTKFCEQLPDAIDLMVAVLRSGHSISQAVQAVAQEIPDPCGEEHRSILHRMNLGQPLSQALVLSARRFQSYELDLLRRAVAIQSEVGGSLAELLDKTNSTLRQRLKLVRQLKVLTAQSRLSAQIVGALPIILAFVLNYLNPGYLQILIQDPLGRALLTTAIVLEIFGIFIMNRMSTMRI